MWAYASLVCQFASLELLCAGLVLCCWFLPVFVHWVHKDLLKYVAKKCVFWFVRAYISINSSRQGGSHKQNYISLWLGKNNYVVRKYKS